MKPFFFSVAICLIVCTSCNWQSQTQPTGSEPPHPDVKEAIGFINIFFDKYKNEGTSKAFDYIFSTNKTVNGLEALKSKIDSARVVLGDFTGFEKITEKDASNGLVLFSYLVKHKNQPIRFTFIFYKPQNNWILYKFNYDADVTDELINSGKIYFIR